MRPCAVLRGVVALGIGALVAVSVSPKTMAQQGDDTCASLGLGGLQPWQKYEQLVDKWEEMFPTRCEDIVGCLESMGVGDDRRGKKVSTASGATEPYCPDLLRAKCLLAQEKKQDASDKWDAYEKYRAPLCKDLETELWEGEDLIAEFRAVKDELVSVGQAEAVRRRRDGCTVLKDLGLESTCEPLPSEDALASRLRDARNEARTFLIGLGDIPDEAAGVLEQLQSTKPADIAAALGGLRGALESAVKTRHSELSCPGDEIERAQSVPENERGNARFQEYFDACAANSFVWVSGTRWGGALDRLKTLDALPEIRNQITTRYQEVRDQRKDRLERLRQDLSGPCGQFTGSRLADRIDAGSVKSFCQGLSALDLGDTASLASLVTGERALGEIGDVAEWTTTISTICTNIRNELNQVRGNCSTQLDALGRVTTARQQLSEGWSGLSATVKVQRLSEALEAYENCEFGAVAVYRDALASLEAMRTAILAYEETRICNQSPSEEQVLGSIVDQNDKNRATNQENKAKLREFRGVAVRIAGCVNDKLAKLREKRLEDEREFGKRVETLQSLVPDVSKESLSEEATRVFTRVREGLERLSKSSDSLEEPDDGKLDENWTRPDVRQWCESLNGRVLTAKGDPGGREKAIAPYCVAAYLLAAARMLDQDRSGEAQVKVGKIQTDCGTSEGTARNVVEYFKAYTTNPNVPPPNAGLTALGYDTNFERGLAMNGREGNR